LPVPFTFAVATGRVPFVGVGLAVVTVPFVGVGLAVVTVPFVGVPFVGALGVSLGLARTTMVTIGLRRNERTKRASTGMHGARERGSQTDKAKRLQRTAGVVNDGSQRKRTGNPSPQAGWVKMRSTTFNAASRRYFGVAIRRHLPPVTVFEGVSDLASRTHSTPVGDDKKDAVAALTGSG
jgi:hypothetical protein